ncbi:dihydrodipicolinate synthase family protein [Saccharopolyspora sp. ASAGF58]|uniref:dihydrodipicolinate synthase family protein n=1 Tax=Saccharopolyspora sp. ASAGF58 TaxID=2719023 RepID=UPI001B3090A5|nr:dihydrodipicolinate synthase family protein [Saccharopolyspora sp. ASAGF58]
MVLQGVFSAVATPFRAEDNSVDERALRLLVERTLDGKVHGLVPCHSTGEFAQLSSAERRKVVEIVIDQTCGRVPVVPHTGAMTKKETIELSRHAERAGASAVMAVPPYQQSLEPDEVKPAFRALADAISIPVVVCNAPTAAGVLLGPQEIADLAAKSPNIRYVEETSGDFSQAAALIHHYSDVISTFVGRDTLLLTAFLEGAAGSITGSSNFLAPQLVSVYESVRRGDLRSAEREWGAVLPVLRFLTSGSYAAGVKDAMKVLGIPAGSTREPTAVLDEERKAALESILHELDVEL